jgi:hypothetical protein
VIKIEGNKRNKTSNNLANKKVSASKHIRRLSKPLPSVKYDPFVQAKEIDLLDNDSSDDQFNNTDDFE